MLFICITIYGLLSYFSDPKITFSGILHIQENVTWNVFYKVQFSENFWRNIWTFYRDQLRRCLQLRWHHKCSRISLEWRMRLSLVTIFCEGRYTYAMHLCQHEIIPTVKSIFNFDNADLIATELINL